MLNVEKVLKDLNLRLARFGDSDVVTTRPLLSSRLWVGSAQTTPRDCGETGLQDRVEFDAPFLLERYFYLDA